MAAAAEGPPDSSHPARTQTAGSVHAARAPQHPPDRGAAELYMRDLASRIPLTREGEVAIGRRIEFAEREILLAWLRSPPALVELVRTTADVEGGWISPRDLLCLSATEPDIIENACSGLMGILADVRLLVERLSLAEGSAPDEQEAAIAARLAEYRLDSTVAERLDRALKARAQEGSSEERAAARRTLSTIARARRRVAEAKSELVEANLRLSFSIARQFQRFGVPLLDLVQEGNLGLMRAADTFDYRRGHRFGTYAGWWIKQSIRRALPRQAKAVRMPTHLSAARAQVLRARRELTQFLGREPTLDEVAEHSRLPLDRVRAISELGIEPLSLDAPIGDEGDACYGDFLASDTPSADELLAHRRAHEATRLLLNSLSAREREILVRHFGLDGEEDATLEEIGKVFSLTRERIRQIEARALEKLRPRSRRRAPTGYFDL